MNALTAWTVVMAELIAVGAIVYRFVVFVKHLYENDDVGERMETKDIEEALLMIHWMSQSGDFREYSKSDRLVGTPDGWKPDDINEAAKAAHKYWKKHGRK